jgi:hypothetical protein
MALISMRSDLDYINYWCEAANVTEQQREVLVCYTALYCVDFMSELGQQFNKESAEPVDREKVRLLDASLDDLLNQI